MTNPQETIVVNEHPQCSTSEKESLYKSSKSISELFDDNFYDTLKISYRKGPSQQESLSLGQRKISDLIYISQNPFLSNLSHEDFRLVHSLHENHVNVSITSSSKDSMPKPSDLRVLSLQLAK